MSEILLIGEYSAESPPHLATEAAIRHAAAYLNRSVSVRWVSTADIRLEAIRQTGGIWVAPGSPYRDMQGALEAIRVAREEGIPCLGTCGGFQHMIIEYARNVLAFDDASHEEYDPYASRLFISRLVCSLVGRTLPLRFTAGSQVATIYGSLEATESYYCNFGVNPDLVDLFRQGQLRISGSDSEGEVRVVELPDHPFFIGTLFLPQTRSTELSPHPLVVEFIRQAS